MIQSGQVLTSRSICDYNCVFQMEVIERKKSFATVRYMGNVKRCKVQMAIDGREFIRPAEYSMAPVFYANN